MTNLRQDCRHGLRVLRHSPGFSGAAILILALGIGANVGVFSVVNTLVLQPRPGRIDSLVGLFNRSRTRPEDYHNFSYPAYLELRERRDIFESLLAQSFTTLGIRDGDLPRQAFGAVVSSNYFDTLGVKLAVGRAFTAEEERPSARAAVAIASYDVWRRARLNPAFIGSTVRIDGIDFTVVGVAPKDFGGIMAFVSPQWWLPLGAYETIVNDLFKERSTGLGDRQNYALNLAGALAPGVTRASAGPALDAFERRIGEANPESDRDRTVIVAGLQRTGVSSRPQSDGPLVALGALLSLISTLVLVIACLNLANLMLARGAARRREIAIRLAIGSGRRRIVQQLLVEGLMLSTAGAAIGLVIGWWMTRALAAWIGGIVTFGIDFLVAPSPRLVGAAVAFAIGSAALFALGPAWSLSNPDVASDLKSESGHVSRRANSWLVVAQLAASLALVVAAGLFTRGAVNAAAIDAGFPMARQLVVELDPSLAGYDRARTRGTYQRALQRLRNTPGVERASFASTVAFGDIMMSGRARVQPDPAEIDATFDVIGSDYFDTLGLPMVRGREFTLAEEQTDSRPPVAIIDTRLARQLFGEADPIGRSVLWRVRQAETAQPYIIVGVAPALRHDLFDLMPKAHLYLPYGSRFTTEMYLHIRTAGPEAAQLATIRYELQQIDPSLPIVFAKTMTGLRDTSMSSWSVRAAATLFGAFGVLALLLAAVGVYGLKAYDVSRRTREIGIRMALGATAADVERQLLTEGARTAGIGLAIGALLAIAIGWLASRFLLQVSPFDPAVITTAVIVLTTAALLASYVPVRRATRVAPVDALRTE
ncbi:MAG TPA: ABC transporter permease [Vicinamibacterales bacterium]|nr:ABC transporter permease [Vicinamibacterales bacterium]